MLAPKFDSGFRGACLEEKGSTLGGGMGLVEGVHFMIFAVVVYLVDFAGVISHFGVLLPDLGAVFPGFLPESGGGLVRKCGGGVVRRGGMR